MKYFKANAGYFLSIKEVDVERETDGCVWIDGRKCARKSQHDNFFKDRQTAKEFIVNDILLEISRHENILSGLREKLDRATKL